MSNWKVLVLAFKAPDGTLRFMEFVVQVKNGDDLLITDGFVVATDEIGRDRAAMEDLEYIGCRILDLKEEVE